MKESSKSILEVAQGEILKKTDYELSKLIANINDPNTSEKSKRKLTITLTLQPINGRENVILTSDVKSVLAPLTPTEIILSNVVRADENGECINVLQEVSKQARGQVNFDGTIFEPEVFYIGHNADKTIFKQDAVSGGEQTC